MCVCLCVRACVDLNDMYVNVYMYVYVYVYLYVCVHVCMYVCMYVCVRTVPAVRASCSNQSIERSFIVIMVINADVTKPNQPLTDF